MTRQKEHGPHQTEGHTVEQALATFEGWETVVFGAILMLSMIFLPKGLVPTLAAKFGKGN